MSLLLHLSNQGLNNRGELQCYVVIFNQLQDHSERPIQAPELCVRGPFTNMESYHNHSRRKLDLNKVE